MSNDVFVRHDRPSIDVLFSFILTVPVCAWTFLLTLSQACNKFLAVVTACSRFMFWVKDACRRKFCSLVLVRTLIAEEGNRKSHLLSVHFTQCRRRCLYTVISNILCKVALMKWHCETLTLLCCWEFNLSCVWADRWDPQPPPPPPPSPLLQSWTPSLISRQQLGHIQQSITSNHTMDLQIYFHTSHHELLTVCFPGCRPHLGRRQTYTHIWLCVTHSGFTAPSVCSTCKCNHPVQSVVDGLWDNSSSRHFLNVIRSVQKFRCDWNFWSQQLFKIKLIFHP